MFPVTQTLPATMTVTYESKTHEIEAELALDDDLLLRTMSTIYPELGTGKVVRNRRGGVETITMIKEAASKGCLATVVEDLINAPESRNPMMALFEQINSVDVVALSAADRALLTGKIEEAVEKGDFLRKVLTAARERLENSKSVAAHSIPLGF